MYAREKKCWTIRHLSSLSDHFRLALDVLRGLNGEVRYMLINVGYVLGT